MALPSFLGETTVDIPTGGDFVPSGIIGKVTAGVFYRVGWVETDLAEFGDQFKPVLKVPSSTNKFRYYFKDRDEANAAAEACGSTYGSETAWVLEVPKASILNLTADVLEKFQDNVRYDVEVKTPSSKKSRHLYHLIALPHAVQTMALLLGYITEPIFNTNELVQPDREYNDEFQKEYIGDPDNGKVEGMLDSELGRRRAALWAALGETDPKNYRMAGTGKFATTSEKLSNCLAIVERVWTSPVYAEVVSYFDPRVDSVNSSNGNRNRVAALVRIFKSETDAKAAAEEQLAARAARDGGTPAHASGGGPAKPALPNAWAGMEADFVDSLKGYTNKPAVIAAKDLGITPDEFNAWKAYLG